MQKYKGTIITRGGLKYELYAVRGMFHSASWDIHWEEHMVLYLMYTIVSKTTQAQNEMLLKAKQYCREDKRMPDREGRKKLWIEDRYDADSETILGGNINLKIKL